MVISFVEIHSHSSLQNLNRFIHDYQGKTVNKPGLQLEFQLEYAIKIALICISGSAVGDAHYGCKYYVTLSAPQILQ